MNTIVHFELPAADAGRAKGFWSGVFGWTFQELPGTTYLLFRAGSPPNGSFYLVKRMPKKGQVNVYVEVDDIDAKLKEIRKARGKVLLKKTAVGTMGWMAQFATPDGCFMSLWQSAPRSADTQAATPII